MKMSVLIIPVIAATLAGCAGTGYRSHYGSGYGYSDYSNGGYGYGYSQPSTIYYEQPTYIYRPAPRHEHEHRDHFNPQRYWGKVEQRLENQQNRIREGVESGQLTRGEAERLLRQQERISERVDRGQQRNWISPETRENINNSLNRASDSIRDLRHNDHQADRPVRDHHRDHRKND